MQQSGLLGKCQAALRSPATLPGGERASRLAQLRSCGTQTVSGVN